MSEIRRYQAYPHPDDAGSEVWAVYKASEMDTLLREAVEKLENITNAYHTLLFSVEGGQFSEPDGMERETRKFTKRLNAALEPYDERETNP